MSNPVGLVLCVVVGFITGVINVIAGGGSFMSLPFLLFLGLPAPIANGTNRVGLLAQNAGAVWGFHRHGLMEWKWGLIVSVPMLVGGGFGLVAAIYVPDSAFRRLLSVVMVLMTIWTIVQSRMGRARVDKPLRSPLHWTMIVSFFVIGLYGGFLQAGIGFLILAVTTVAGMDLVRGNAVKVLTVLVLTILALAFFATTGHVDWPLASALAIGNTIGSLAGVRLAIASGQRWLEHVVTVTTLVFAVLLWLT